MNYDADNYSHGYIRKKEAFRALTKDDILKPFKSFNDFTSSKINIDLGNNVYVSDIRYQKNLEGAQPIKVEIKNSENVPAGIYGYAPVSTNKWWVSVSSDGQRHFDLIYV